MEIETYFKKGEDGIIIGGWSCLYCKETWDDWSLKNNADLEVFEILFKIDTQNGTETSKIFQNLCKYGAYEAVEVTIMM